MWSMLHGSSILASRREERVQKAVSVDHHEPGDGRQRHGCYTLSAAQKATLWVWSSLFYVSEKESCGLSFDLRVKVYSVYYPDPLSA